LLHELHQETVHTLLNTQHDSSAKMKQLRGFEFANVLYFLDALRIYSQTHHFSESIPGTALACKGTIL